MSTHASSCLLFVHIPKTAGTSFNATLFGRYSPYNFKVGVWGGVRRSLAELYRLNESERSALQCVHGHMPYGVHAAIPGDTWYYSLFREPVARVISLYRHRVRKDMLPEGTTLREFVLSDEFEVENGMTKRLAGRHAGPNRDLPRDVVSDIYGTPCPGPCTDAEFQLATERVAGSNYVVGIQERFDESLLYLHHTHDWPAPIGVGMQNSDPRPQPAWEPEDLELIRQRNAYDLTLYETVNRKFDSQVLALGQEFQFERTIVDALNRLLGDEVAVARHGGAGPALLAHVEGEFESGRVVEGATELRLLASGIGGPFEDIHRQYLANVG